MSGVWPAAKGAMLAAVIMSALVWPGGAHAQNPEEQNEPGYMPPPSAEPNDPPPEEPAYQGNDVRPDESAPDLNQGGNDQPNENDPGAPPQDQQNNDQRGVM